MAELGGLIVIVVPLSHPLDETRCFGSRFGPLLSAEMGRSARFDSTRGVTSEVDVPFVDEKGFFMLCLSWLNERGVFARAWRPRGVRARKPERGVTPFAGPGGSDMPRANCMPRARAPVLIEQAELIRQLLGGGALLRSVSHGERMED